jgi:hypothetical protein
MQQHGGDEIQLLLIVDLGSIRDEWSASRPGRVFLPGKDHRYPLDRRLSGFQELGQGFPKTKRDMMFKQCADIF